MRKAEIREALELALMVNRKQGEAIAAAQAVIDDALSHLHHALSIIKAQDTRYDLLLQRTPALWN